MHFGQQNVPAVIEVSRSDSVLGKMEDLREMFLDLRRKGKHAA